MQSYRTTKLIFLCPIIGLLLCIYGLFELFFKAKEVDVKPEVETRLISEDDKTKQLKIILDEEDLDSINEINDYSEVPIKEIKDKNDIPEDESIKIEEDIFNTKEVKNVVDLVNEEQNKEEVPVEIFPDNYYISGKSLICEFVDESIEEINLEDVKEVTRFIDLTSGLIKIRLITDKSICFLTKKKDISLEQMGNMIHNKMLAIDENFKEFIEYVED